MATTILNADGSPSNGNGGPWWVKSIWTLGPLTIIALGLVYLLAFDVRTDARAAAKAATEVQRELAAHHTHTEQLHQNIESYMRIQNILTSQLCANAAKTDEQRDRCFPR